MFVARSISLLSQHLKKILLNILSLLLVGAVFYFLGKEVGSHWHKIAEFKFHFRISILALASVTYVATFIILGFAWWLLLRDLNYKIPLGMALIYYFISQPCKYVPGKVWIAVARAKLGKHYGIPTSVAFLTTGLEGIFEIITGTYISVFALLASPMFGTGAKWACALFIVLGLMLIIPKIFYFCVNSFLGLTKQTQIESKNRMGWRKLVMLQIIFACAMALMGLSQVLFLYSFTRVPLAAAPYLVSIGTFSYVASIIAVFTPSGLGVREGVWYVALEKVVAEHIALIFALVSRFWTIIIEALLAFISLAFILVQRKNGHLHGAKECSDEPI